MGLDKKLSQLMDCPLPTKESQEMLSITLKLQNFRGISVSYVVWSIEMSLTETQLGPYFLR